MGGWVKVGFTRKKKISMLGKCVDEGYPHYPGTYMCAEDKEKRQISNTRHFTRREK